MNAMFIMRGQVVNVFTAPKGVNKQSGEEYGGQDKVQIMGDIPLPDGEYKKELISLTTEQGAALKQMEGKEVTCPVAFYTSGKVVGFYIPKGHKVTLINPSKAA
jgi:hypothetical protein